MRGPLAAGGWIIVILLVGGVLRGLYWLAEVPPGWVAGWFGWARPPGWVQLVSVTVGAFLAVKVWGWLWVTLFEREKRESAARDPWEGHEDERDDARDRAELARRDLGRLRARNQEAMRAAEERAAAIDEEVRRSAAARNDASE